MLKNVEEQVVVITGASSGIGRASALEFGRRGASVALVARNREALETVAAEIRGLGGSAEVLVADVADWAQVQRLAAETVERFGRIDTWVNNASLYLAGPFDEIEIEATQRLMQVNVMGQIHGMKAAVPYLKQEGRGALINVSSGLAVRSAPWLAAYSASKHAVKGYTEAIRMEIQRDYPEIAVTNILPASINTPFFRHARSKLGVQPRPLPPIYEPEQVAEAIVFAAEHPRRDIHIGPGRLLAMSEGLMPGLVDRAMLARDLAFRLQLSDRPNDGQDNFERPMSGSGSVEGEWGDESRRHSLFTRLVELHPRRAAATVAALTAGVMLLRRRAAS